MGLDALPCPADEVVPPPQQRPPSTAHLSAVEVVGRRALTNCEQGAPLLPEGGCSGGRCSTIRCAAFETFSLVRWDALSTSRKPGRRCEVTMRERCLANPAASEYALCTYNPSPAYIGHVLAIRHHLHSPAVGPSGVVVVSLDPRASTFGRSRVADCAPGATAVWRPRCRTAPGRPDAVPTQPWVRPPRSSRSPGGQQRTPGWRRTPMRPSSPGERSTGRS